MPKLSTIVSALAALCYATSSGAQNTARSDSVALVVLNRGYVDAFMHGDAAWYDAHLAPEYECLAPNGAIVSRAAFIAGSRTPMTYQSFGLDSVRVKLVGDVALITAITPFVRADGTRGVSRYTDTWVRRGSTWMTYQAQITTIGAR